ncbi:MAG TPA: class I SAM-dependent methyltransferase, partial [Burkholderiaceae bacterium]|nr:class I SAM-dependent methyltransferase [Burkholderiaceae bacterium]
FSSRLHQYAGLLETASLNVSRVISSQDEMMHGKFNTDEVYMSVGRSALHLAISALIANDLDAPKTILDLPCGHGREARFFRAAFPTAELYACDVNMDGVNFCSENFGMHPVQSTVDLSKLALPAKFDLIWCGSLLTHLDSARATQLLDKFAEHLNPGGLMLFSSHGRMHANFVHDKCFKLTSDELFEQIKTDYLRLGYGYAEYPGVPQFGLSLTSPAWIFNYVYRRSDLTLCSFSEKAWHGLHDVTVLQKTKLDQYLYPTPEAATKSV